MPSSPETPITIVGIGASAGGLAALRELFERLPNDTGLSFVVVVHLAPDHESHLADLLQPHCSMPVQQVDETVPLRPDHVYVIPPGCNLAAVDTHLRLSDIEPDRRDRGPIDHFFQTLADTHDGNSIGIVLTGTGTDGTAGLAAIRAAGGLTIVQDPADSEYDGMPRSALLAGAVDLVKSLDGIAVQLRNVVAQQADTVLPVGDGDEPSAEVQDVLRQIYAQIRDRTGHDTTGYKQSTILRRDPSPHAVAPTVVLRRSTSACCGPTRRGRPALQRRPDLGDELLPRSRGLRGTGRAASCRSCSPSAPGRDTVRSWSVGCSTGEEAYSLGMLLLEHAAGLADPPTIQIFASDLHEPSLQQARDGVYPPSIEAEVSPERLQRFFVPDNGNYRVCPELRELMVFAPHGLLRDPPFSHMDLIVCRNLLIYLQRDTQHLAANVFHYALEPGGHLLLGSSETIDGSDLFTTVDKHLCLFRRREQPGAANRWCRRSCPRRRPDRDDPASFGRHRSPATARPCRGPRPTARPERAAERPDRRRQPDRPLLRGCRPLRHAARWRAHLRCLPTRARRPPARAAQRRSRRRAPITNRPPVVRFRR